MIFFLRNEALGRLLTFLIIVVPFLLDIASGALAFHFSLHTSIAMFGRLLITMLLMFLLFYNANLRIIVSTIFLALFFILSNLYVSIVDSSVNVFYAVNFYVKTLYCFLVLTVLFRYYKRLGIDIRHVTFCCRFLAVTFFTVFLFSFLTGYGFLSYGEYAFGIKSYFDGGNDIGLACLLVSSILLYSSLVNKSWYDFLMVMLLFLPLALIGSRAGWFGMAVIISMVLFYGGKLLLRDVFRIPFYNFFSMFFLVLLLSSLAIFGDLGSGVLLSDVGDYHLERLTNFVDNSPRGILIGYALDEISNRSLYSDFFGQGMSFYEGIAKSLIFEYGVPDRESSVFAMKEVEQDFFDLVGFFGFPFALVVCLTHFGLFIRSLECCKYQWFTPLFVGVALFNFHSYIAGHAYFSSTVAPIYAVLLFTILNVLDEEKRKRC